MKNILIAGGTGLIGSALSKLLVNKGYSVTILSRQKNVPSGNISYASWDPEKNSIDAAAVANADIIVHVAGENVGKGRWTKKRKKQILESRTKTSSLLMDAIKQHKGKLTSFISASAIGWYGADPVIPNPRPFTEDQPAAAGFLGETCKAWEDSVQEVRSYGIRLVILRTGIVLSNEGGVYPEYRKPLKFGMAPILGNGNQMISWIHIDDLARMYVFAIENENMQGVYNAVAPQPVNNRDMMLALASEVRKQFYLPVYVPAFALKLALGEMSIEVLKSTTVSDGKIRREGFNFIYPSIDAAIKELNNNT